MWWMIDVKHVLIKVLTGEKHRTVNCFAMIIPIFEIIKLLQLFFIKFSLFFVALFLKTY